MVVLLLLSWFLHGGCHRSVKYIVLTFSFTYCSPEIIKYENIVKPYLHQGWCGADHYSSKSISTLVCCQPTELIWVFLFQKIFNFTPPSPLVNSFEASLLPPTTLVDRVQPFTYRNIGSVASVLLAPGFKTPKNHRMSQKNLDILSIFLNAHSFRKSKNTTKHLKVLNLGLQSRAWISVPKL